MSVSEAHNIRTPSYQEHESDFGLLAHHLPQELLESLGGPNNVLATIPKYQNTISAEGEGPSPMFAFSDTYFYSHKLTLQPPENSTEIAISSDFVAFIMQRKIEAYPKFFSPPQPRQPTSPTTLIMFSHSLHPEGIILGPYEKLPTEPNIMRQWKMMFWPFNMPSLATISQLIKDQNKVIQTTTDIPNIPSLIEHAQSTPIPYAWLGITHEGVQNANTSYTDKPWLLRETVAFKYLQIRIRETEAALDQSDSDNSN